MVRVFVLFAHVLIVCYLYAIALVCVSLVIFIPHFYACVCVCVIFAASLFAIPMEEVHSHIPFGSRPKPLRELKRMRDTCAICHVHCACAVRSKK